MADAKISTLSDAQDFVAALGCGQETSGPNVWRVTTHDAQTAMKVVDALKKAGIYMWKPRTDPVDAIGKPDNAELRETGKVIKGAVKDYPLIGKSKAGPFFIDVGWEYKKVAGAEQPVVTISHSKPRVMAIEAK